MSKSFSVLGLELGGDVVDWASIEETKEVLLARAQLFVGELTLKLQNSLGQYSYDNPVSPFKGKQFLNTVCVISVDGEALFAGPLKDIALDHASRIASFVIENQLSRVSEASVVLTQSGLNPAAAMIALFKSVGLGDLLDVGSFLAAGGPSAQAGATVSLNFQQGNNVTLLDAIQKLSDLASISVYSSGLTIRALAFRPYQGNLSALRAGITPDVVRKWGAKRRAYQTYNNRVTVNYGASSTFTADDVLSQQETGVTKPFQFQTATGQDIAVADLTSAAYFGQTFLQRASMVRTIIDAQVGSAFQNSHIGDRHPVTAPHWGLVQAPFEIIEVHRLIQENAVNLTLASL